VVGFVKKHLWLLLVIALAAAVRLWGLGWGLPHSYHPDEGSIIFRAMIFGTGDLNPHWFRWPTLPMYLMFGIYGALYVAGRLLGQFGSTQDFLRLYISDPTVFWYLGRLVSAAAGVLTVLMCYLIGKKLFSRAVGLLAALFLGLCYLHVRDSHYATPDVLLALFMVLSFWFCIRIVEDGTWKSYVLAAAFAGVAVSTKYVGGFMMCVTIFLVHMKRGATDKKLLDWKFHRFLVLAGIVAFAAFVVGTPYSILDWHRFSGDVLGQATMVSGETAAGGQELTLGSYAGGLKRIFFENLMNGMGVPLFILFVLGMAFSLRVRERGHYLLWTYWLPYFIAFSLMTIRRATYFTPLLPVCALFAGWVVVHLAASRRGRIAAVIATVLAVSYSAYQVVSFDSLLHVPDTRTMAKHWFEENTPDGTAIALEQYGPELNKTKDQLKHLVETDTTIHDSWQKSNQLKNRLEYEVLSTRQPAYRVYDIPSMKLLSGPYSKTEYGEYHDLVGLLQEQEIQYVVTSSKAYTGDRERNPEEETSKPVRDRLRFYHYVRDHGEVIKTFSASRKQPRIDQEEGLTFHNPILKLYKLDHHSRPKEVG